jgi:hypothetical protein
MPFSINAAFAVLLVGLREYQAVPSENVMMLPTWTRLFFIHIHIHIHSFILPYTFFLWLLCLCY